MYVECIELLFSSVNTWGGWFLPMIERLFLMQSGEIFQFPLFRLLTPLQMALCKPVFNWTGCE